MNQLKGLVNIEGEICIPLPYPGPDGGGVFQRTALLDKVFPVMNQLIKCPVKRQMRPLPFMKHEHWQFLGYMLIHLNDYHKWSRERIADWLETLDLDITARPESIGD